MMRGIPPQQAIEWASASIAMEFNFNTIDKVGSIRSCFISPSFACRAATDPGPFGLSLVTCHLSLATQIRAGRVLGRCHAARGEHELSVAALEASLQLAKRGRYLWSEALMVGARYDQRAVERALVPA